MTPLEEAALPMTAEFLLNLTPTEEAILNTLDLDISSTSPLPLCTEPILLMKSSDNAIPSVHSSISQSPESRDKLTFYYHNMSGLRSKLPEFRNDLANCPYDVVFISETWFQEGITNAEIVPREWRLFREDRKLDPSQPINARGGGVAIATRHQRNPISISFDLPLTRIFDLTCCKIPLSNYFIFLICFYIPPSSPEDQYILLANCIADLLLMMADEDVVFALGDVNMPGIEWIESEFNDNYFDPINIDPRFQPFLETLMSFGLFQLNNLLNQSGNALDLVFTNINHDVTLSEAQLTLTDKTSIHHKILAIDYFYDVTNPIISTPQTYVSYEFDKADYDPISFALNGLDFNFESEEIDILFDNIHSAILELIEQFVPKRTRNVLTCPPHFDKALRILRNRRNTAFKRMRSTNL